MWHFWQCFFIHLRSLSATRAVINGMQPRPTWLHAVFCSLCANQVLSGWSEQETVTKGLATVHKKCTEEKNIPDKTGKS